MRNLTAVFVVSTSLAFAGFAQAQTLKGSSASMQRQYQVAVDLGYSFLQTPQAVTRLVDSGYLIKVSPNRHFDLHAVSYPYARPAVKTFIERLSSQYYAACGEKLTVTSLTRPIDRQPANAHSESVHPTGMAVDLRIPRLGKCRSWLENTLLSLESADVLDVTRERNPPHYHVAVFPQSYETYVASLEQSGGDTATSMQQYVVRSGDSLFTIARRTGSSIEALRAANNLRGDLIHPGLKLQVPVPGNTPTMMASSEADEPAVREVTHLVKRGETLWRVAHQYGTSVNALRRENGLTGDFLQVGQTLKVTMALSSR